MKCIHLRIRTKKGTKYLYCNFNKDNAYCSECENHEYKKYKPLAVKNIKDYKLKKKQLTKKTDIPMTVKKKVFERDKGCCVICGNSNNVMPNAHYIRRSKNGLGIEQNVFTACTELTPLKCHSNFDKFGIGKEQVINNFKKNYEDWNEDNLIYKKWGN